MRRLRPGSCRERAARRRPRRACAALALAWLTVGTLSAADADVAPRVLRVIPVPVAPSDATPGASAGGATVQLCAVAYEPAEPVVLDALARPAGWTAGAAASGRPGCLLAAPGAAPLEIRLADGRDRVALRFERAPGGGAAVVELAGRTRLVELVGEGAADVEMGRGVATHAWREPRTVPYERALVRDAGFVADGDARFAKRLALDRPHGLEPHPILPSAVATLPLEITFPEVFVPADGAVEIGLAHTGATDAPPLSVRVEARFVPLHGGADRVHAVTVLAGRALQRATVPLATRAEGPGTLTLRLAATDAARAGASVELVDPLLRGART